MSLSIWELLLLVTKCLTYIVTAVEIGGGSMLLLSWPNVKLRKQTLAYMRLGVYIGLLAITAYFMCKVAVFADTGIDGLIDRQYASILWHSETGKVFGMRLVALVILLVATLNFGLCSKHPMHSGLKIPATALWAFGSISLAYSYSFIGHSSEINYFVRFFLIIHVLAVAGWIGSLYPLWRACDAYGYSALKTAMKTFGEIAMLVVSVLFIAGVIMLGLIMGSLFELFTTAYGLVMLLKLVLVVTIMGLAAWHKWKLVPVLMDIKGVTALRKSILLEMLLALAILGVTVVLSSVVGPLKLM